MHQVAIGTALGVGIGFAMGTLFAGRECCGVVHRDDAAQK